MLLVILFSLFVLLPHFQKKMKIVKQLKTTNHNNPKPGRYEDTKKNHTNPPPVRIYIHTIASVNFWGLVKA